MKFLAIGPTEIPDQDPTAHAAQMEAASRKRAAAYAAFSYTIDAFMVVGTPADPRLFGNMFKWFREFDQNNLDKTTKFKFILNKSDLLKTPSPLEKIRTQMLNSIPHHADSRLSFLEISTFSTQTITDLSKELLDNRTNPSGAKKKALGSSTKFFKI